jgi:hypothetical protein
MTGLLAPPGLDQDRGKHLNQHSSDWRERGPEKSRSRPLQPDDERACVAVRAPVAGLGIMVPAADSSRPYRNGRHDRAGRPPRDEP